MPSNYRYFAWAWIIIIGGLMITPGGIVPIVTSTLGVISIAIGIAGLVVERKFSNPVTGR